jgi:SnoaL-like domain
VDSENNSVEGTAMTSSVAGSGGSTEEVLARHWRDFQAGDVESILKDYAQEAMVITPNGTRKGVGQIREAFQTMFTEIMPAKTSASKLEKEVVEGELAFIVWSGSSDKYKISFATDTFLIRGGKIVMQTFAPVMEKK